MLCGCQVAQWKLPPIRTLPGASPRQLAAADVRGGGAAPTAIVDAELHACLAEFDEVRRCKSRRRYKYNRMNITVRYKWRRCYKYSGGAINIAAVL